MPVLKLSVCLRGSRRAISEEMVQDVDQVRTEELARPDSTPQVRWPTSSTIPAVMYQR